MNARNCPYCNSPLPVLAAPPANDKQPCPRCGESVLASHWPVDPALATALKTGDPPPRPPVAEQPPDFRAANRKTGLIILGIMVSMALIGLSYALWTKQIRRDRDPKKVERLEPIAARRPTELSAFGFLPPDSQVIAALHIAEMLNDKQTGKALLAEPRPALLDWSARHITRTTGLKFEDLDHIVFASALDLQSLQLVMIVKSRMPVSPEKIAEMRPKKSSLHEDRPLYEFSFDPLGEALLWCVDDRLLIYVVRLDEPRVEHLRGLTVTPRKVGETIPAPLRKVMDERLPKHPFAWAVGRLDKLDVAKAWLPLVLGAKGDIGPLKDVQTFALGVEPIEGLTLKGEFQLPSAKSAAAFKSFLEDVKIDGARSQKVEAPPPTEPEQWVSWQVRGDPVALRELLNRGKDAKKQ
jgi:hypothetical protein